MSRHLDQKTMNPRGCSASLGYTCPLQERSRHTFYEQLKFLTQEGFKML